MLLIGSKALRVHGIQTGRVALDTDVIATYDELGELTRRLRRMADKVVSIPVSTNKTVLRTDDGTIVEVEIAWEGSTGANLRDHVENVVGSKLTDVFGMAAYAASVDSLYTLKMSHRYLKNSPHFLKTMQDIRLLRSLDAKVFNADWLKRREDETYWYKHPKLNVEKRDFFGGDGVEYVYDHDTIHVSMAHKRIGDYRYEGPLVLPAYRFYMKDGEQVQTSKKKFFEVDEQIRLWGVLEEAQVLALERSQIPFRGKVDPKRSFDIALMKVCTSITSGWFREFAWENYDKVQELYEPDYVTRFWKAVEDGIVRKLEPGEIHTY